jgi:hypothetical protein
VGDDGLPLSEQDRPRCAEPDELSRRRENARIVSVREQNARSIRAVDELETIEERRHRSARLQGERHAESTP